MGVDIRFLGHASFELTGGGATVLIDPFLTGNPQAEAAGITAKSLACDTMVLTHGHGDHTADAAPIAKRTGATVHAAFELCALLGEHGIEKLEPQNPGGRVETAFGWVAFTPALHSSSYENNYAGQPMGAVVRIGDKTVYHLGDTALFTDLKLMGELYKPDIALVPVGDRFTMGPEHAKLAAEWVGAPIAVPIHYATWPALASDISAFSPAGVEVRAIKPGETISL